jgi:hypothetical protein
MEDDAYVPAPGSRHHGQWLRAKAAAAAAAAPGAHVGKPKTAYDRTVAALATAPKPKDPGPGSDLTVVILSKGRGSKVDQMFAAKGGMPTLTWLQPTLADGDGEVTVMLAVPPNEVEGYEAMLSSNGFADGEVQVLPLKKRSQSEAERFRDMTRALSAVGVAAKSRVVILSDDVHGFVTHDGEGRVGPIDVNVFEFAEKVFGLMQQRGAVLGGLLASPDVASGLEDYVTSHPVGMGCLCTYQGLHQAPGLLQQTSGRAFAGMLNMTSQKRGGVVCIASMALQRDRRKGNIEDAVEARKVYEAFPDYFKDVALVPHQAPVNLWMGAPDFSVGGVAEFTELGSAMAGPADDDDSSSDDDMEED